MSEREEHINYLRAAIQKSVESMDCGGFQAGAIVVKDGVIIGSGVSIGNKLHDPTSHGEIAAIRNACGNLKQSDLQGAVLYTSMQPCLMCFSATMWSGIGEVFYAIKMHNVDKAYYGGDYKTTDINKTFTHPLILTHIPDLEDEALILVQHWERSQAANLA